MHCNTSSSSRSSNVNATREVAPFLKTLRRMLHEESDAVLRWTPDGRAFEIHDMHEMMAHVLPKYFKHRKYTSFQRQLNYFNFRKWTKSKAIVCTFSNDFFLRDQPELAWRITRKKSLSPHSLTKYRPAAATRASVMPYWKREPVAVLSAPHPTSLENMLLPAGDNRHHLPFPAVADNDLLFKQIDIRHVQLSRRCNGFNMGAPSSEPYAASTRSYDMAAGNNRSGEQTEPLDWIDCLLPPTDDAYMCMYPASTPVAPYTANPMNLRKSFEFATL
ncbi:Heat stress transcription factor A-1a [Phytophthora citrophthora]|uniref:Heat stress transcription factor A-1a n=1 Tax=Phytophthora citrophthora TaxID=4793 RepID=A0AAD9FZ08_9STRA|nr:Heat stress transcription factor A-1a [Phytophthora citrophthora]